MFFRKSIPSVGHTQRRIASFCVEKELRETWDTVEQEKAVSCHVPEKLFFTKGSIELRSGPTLRSFSVIVFLIV